MSTFDPQQEKETYQQARKEILGPYWVASTSSAPPMFNVPLSYDRTSKERLLGKVNNLKEFLKICLDLMKDETTFNTLHGMIDHCMQEGEVPTGQRVVN
jgi:hypothetical protein